MENYFLFVTNKTTQEPVDNVEEFMDTYNLTNIIEQILVTEDKSIDIDTYHVSLLCFEVEDLFLNFLDSVTPIPGLIWLAPLDMEDEEDIEDYLPTDTIVC